MSKLLTTGACLLTGLLAVGATASAAEISSDNYREYTWAISRGQRLAAERNTCDIDSVTAVRAYGERALRVTVSLLQGDTPGDLNGEYDGKGSRVTFADEDGNLVSGLHAQQIAGPNKGVSILDGNEGNGPNDARNQMDIPLTSDTPEKWLISRINAIDVTVGGPLVDNDGTVLNAPVICGTVDTAAFVSAPSVATV